jgi:hypothetical protein
MDISGIEVNGIESDGVDLSGISTSYKGPHSDADPARVGPIADTNKSEYPVGLEYHTGYQDLGGNPHHTWAQFCGPTCARKSPMWGFHRDVDHDDEVSRSEVRVKCANPSCNHVIAPIGRMGQEDYDDAVNTPGHAEAQKIPLSEPFPHLEHEDLRVYPQEGYESDAQRYTKELAGKSPGQVSEAQNRTNINNIEDKYSESKKQAAKLAAFNEGLRNL